MSYMKEMKAYYRLSPNDLSRLSIRILRGTAVIGLVAVILGLLMLWAVVPTNLVTGLTLTVGLVIGFIALMQRLPNLLMITDKHLDEWEITSKKNAESFTYRVIYVAMLILMIMGLILSGGDVEDLRLVLTPSLWQLGYTLLSLPFLLKLITTNHIAWSVKPISNEELAETYQASKGKDEPHRKFGKRIILLTVFIVWFSMIGSDLIDRKYETLANEEFATCVINMESEIPFAQMMNLHDCESIAAENKQG